MALFCGILSLLLYVRDVEAAGSNPVTSTVKNCRRQHIAAVAVNGGVLLCVIGLSAGQSAVADYDAPRKRGGEVYIPVRVNPVIRVLYLPVCICGDVVCVEPKILRV